MQIVSVMNQRVKISPAGIDAEAFPKKLIRPVGNTDSLQSC